MVGAQKAVALLITATAIVDGFRVKPKKRQAKTQVIAQDSAGDPEDQGQEMLRRFVDASRELGKSLPREQLSVESLPHCRLSESDCSIGEMSGATLVFTDSADSRCLNGDPFAFLVNPGRSDKLLFYFPGGGACWKGSSSNAELCTQSLADGLGAAGFGAGVSDPRAENPFGDFTFVAPAYCDGGAFISNSTLSGKPQNGFVNTNFAVDWAKRNLDQTLSAFAISGSSAGALGTMAWSHYLLSNFQYNKASVIVDSYMGVFPPGTQGPTIKNFGSCNLPIFADFRAECEAGTSNIQDVYDFAIQSHPRVAFSMIQPKGDLVQIAFYAAIAISFGRLDLVFSTGLYERSNAIKQRFDRHPNFVHFIVDGGGHTYFGGGNFYTATVTGDNGNGGDGGKPTLATWTGALLEHQPVQSACNGPLQRNGGNNWLFKNTRYCFEELFPKTLSMR